MRFIKQFALFLLMIGGLTDISFAQKMKSEEVLAKHLESIGTADARATVKTLIAVGDATAKFVSKKTSRFKAGLYWLRKGRKISSG